VSLGADTTCGSFVMDENAGRQARMAPSRRSCIGSRQRWKVEDAVNDDKDFDSSRTTVAGENGAEESETRRLTGASLPDLSRGR
jgi:hypothetical protein